MVDRVELPTATLNDDIAPRIEELNVEAASVPTSTEPTDYVLDLSDNELSQLVANWKLDAKLNPMHRVSSNLDLAVHQLESHKLYIWRELETLIRVCMPKLKPYGHQIDDQHLEDCLDILFDEYVMRGVRRVLRQTLEGGRVSLAELADEVFDTGSKKNDDYRSRLRDNILYPLQHIGVFSFNILKKKSPKGTEYCAGYHITAGPLLMSFHKHIYAPWAKQQAVFAYNLFNEISEH